MAVKNYADHADQLRAASLEQAMKGTKAATQKAQQEQQQNELDGQKTRELLPLFKQFAGYKVARGLITLESVLWTDDQGKDSVWLRAAGVAAAAEIRLGTGFLSAGAFGSTYKLFRYNPNRPDIPESSDTYSTVDGLMKAVAEAVAKM